MPLVVIFVPAGPSLLSIAPKLAKIIFSERLANAWLLQVTIFLADAPSDVETREVACRHRSKGHPVVVERFIDGFDARAFFDKELRFAEIWTEHAVSNKTHAIADENSDFPESFGKLHASRNGFPACRFASHDFEQTHDICRTEEMRADDELGARRAGSDLVDAQGGRIAGQNGAGFTNTIEFPKDFLLERHAFEDGFDHEVHARKSVEAQGGLNPCQTLIHKLLCEPAALHRVCIIFLYRCHPAVKRRLINFLKQDGKAGVGEDHANATAHGTGADDRRGVYGDDRRFFWDVGNFRNFPLTKEDMNQRLRLVGIKAFGE